MRSSHSLATRGEAGCRKGSPYANRFRGCTIAPYFQTLSLSYHTIAPLTRESLDKILNKFII